MTPKSTDRSLTTCQICGRPILAKTGKIAHHGYKRPDSGWQTSSCKGARYLPYEQSSDRIPEVIAYIESYLAQMSAALKDFMTNPPEILIYEKYRGAWSKREPIEVARPADFDPNNSHYSGISGSYSVLFHDRKRRTETDMKNARESIAYLKDRLAKWTAPIGVSASV